jgi:hypothetical protein
VRIKIVVVDLEETEARNDCAGEGQQKFNRPIEDELIGSKPQVVKQL